MSQDKNERVTMTKGELEALIKDASSNAAKVAAEAAAASVKATLEAIKGPAAVAKPDVDLMGADSTLSEDEKAAFYASFGGGKCSECNQPSVKGRYACKGKHVKMIVFPDDPEWGTFFQGVIVNGAVYLSDGPGHQISVPAENNIAYEVQKWVAMERQNAHGRKRQHNSGTVGRNSSGFKPYNGAGFSG
jgi:hypothetical protein